MTEWDQITDLLVVGSGGGLVGAISASAAGLDTLVIEGSGRIGGSTCMSGGVLWLPNNPLMQREGVEDSLEGALEYFTDVVGDAGRASSEERRRRYVVEGAAMVSFLEQEGMEFIRCEGYSDYYAGHTGIRGGVARGRAIECVPTDLHRIGPLAERLHPSIAAPLVVRTGESATMSNIRSGQGMAAAARVASRTLRGRLRGQRLTSNGAALITQLVEVLLRREVPIWTETPFVDLIQQDGRVTGVVARRGGREHRIRARRGVLIAAGGFSHNAAMRRRYGGERPNEGLWSHSNPSDTGEVLQNLIDHGAATDMLDEAWWNPTILGPDGLKTMVLAERARPHSMIVDNSGARFFNEAISYVEAGQHMYRRRRDTGSGVPSWLILDAQHRTRYMLGMLPPGRTPKAWIEGGHLRRADTLAGLAQQCGVDAAGLAASVERFNGFAVGGVDEDFDRGQGDHDRYWGDYRHRPNPCLGTIEKAPFYAIQVYPGDVGTSGGVVCDACARVLDVDGHVIPGLYAAGNITASVMGRTYPGAGASIGASTVFSYVAANHAAGQVGSQESIADLYSANRPVESTAPRADVGGREEVGDESHR
jgi:3-oxosteroid 1-dehydrogenase